MNKYEEVKRELQEYVNEYGMDYYAQNHFPKTMKLIQEAEATEKRLQELEKKEMPMKVNKKDFEQIGSVRFYKCPNCKNDDILPVNRYCPICGKRLDWSDEK